MDESIPPSPPPLPNTTPRWRWAIHLLLLTAYPVTLGVVGAMNHSGSGQPMLPSNIRSLLAVLVAEAIIFSVIFAIALALSRPSARDLYLTWTNRWKSFVSGFVLSIGLRIAVMIAMLFLGVVLSLTGNANEQVIRQLQPDVEEMVSARGLVNNPLYFVLTLTVVSFVFGGLREELWRAGMLAGFNHLAPPLASRRKVETIAVLVSAVAFAFGHLPQGWGGVLLTGILGIGLGLIIVWKNSIWPAVFAHGFFDATTFALLYLMAKFPEMLPKGSQVAGSLLLQLLL
jgi:membrane protease YdiL (CAAX protease family)